VGNESDTNFPEGKWWSAIYDWEEKEEEPIEGAQETGFYEKFSYCGKCKIRSPGAAYPKDSVYVKRLEDLGIYPEEAASWSFPPRSYGAEKRSLVAHSSRFIYASGPHNEVLGRSIADVCSLYPKPRLCGYMSVLEETGFVSSEYLYCCLNFIALRRVKGNSDPGIPWKTFGKHKESVLELCGDLVFSEVALRLKLLLSTDLRRSGLGAKDLVQLGFCDPVRLFIKKEPHKKSKIMDGFFRLISNVSLCDELIDRLIMSAQNELEIDNWLDIPSKPGIGFTDDMMKEIYARVKAIMAHIPIREGDSSSWDWTVQFFELMAEAECRIILLGVDSSGLCARLIRNRFYCVAWSVFVLSDGSMYQQLVPGIMLSGFYGTSSSNSRIVVLNCVMARAAWVIAMGDDFMSHDVEGLEDVFRTNGHLLKYSEPVSSEFQFCSTRFPSMEPVNIWKTFVKLLNQRVIPYKDRLSLFSQFQEDIRHHPRKEILFGLVQASGFLDCDD